MPGFAQTADDGRHRAYVRKPDRFVGRQSAHDRDRECGVARDGSGRIYRPMAMRPRLFSARVHLLPASFVNRFLMDARPRLDG